MGSNNSFTKLTIGAVLAIVGTLFYLIYQSSAKRKADALEAARIEASAATDVRGLSDTLGTIGTSTAVLPSTAAYPSDTVHNAVDGQFLSSPTKSGIREVTTEDPNSLVSASTKVKSKTKTKSPAATAKSAAAIAKVGPKSPAEGGAKGDLLVMAGAFASKDNADALVTKLKKLGFAHAESVKFGNSANVNVIAGYYEYKGGAEAAVRTLKKSKIDAFIKKKDGEIFKVPAAPKSAAVATKPS